ncbi:Regulator of protease activity HflC, stomatin/prohibitin superfamily [Rhizobiales bacterium GAS191]|nr:Regulator of protease activity HflC, stomatin/prohibitin superfamily [Rhizobiales bacterium GAS191]
MLDQRSVLERTDQPRDRGVAEAARARTSLAMIGLASLIACLTVSAQAFQRVAGELAHFNADPIFIRLAGASLAILAGAFLAAALAADTRLTARRGRIAAAVRPDEAQAQPTRKAGWRRLSVARLLPRLSTLLDAVRLPVRAFIGSLPALVVLAGAGAALVMLARHWPEPAEMRAPANVYFMRGALALIASFPLLLAERAYAGFAGWRLPEAADLQRLLRLALLVFAGEGGLALLQGYGLDASGLVELLLRLLVAAIACELALRALAVFFQPRLEPASARASVTSAVAALLTPDAVSRAAWRQSLHDQLGIDLSRSWALQFVRSAILPVAALLLVVAWGLSGVSILGADQRGIYERLGKPVAVLQPGLHIGLPWPLGVVRRVDFGEIHVLSLGAPATETAALPAEVVGVEGAAPVSADRLWDQTHPTETSYLIASDSAARSAFQIVDVDVKLIWRIGLGDDAALASTYRAAEPRAFLRAFAGQKLARYFSTRTLLGALGEKREGLSEDLKHQLQAALDRASTGIELVAVVVEAIHPPARAADSYHEVQAARIRSQAMISEARRRAIGVMSEAERTTLANIASAQAAAVERITSAQSDALRFSTDEHSYLAAGPAYLFERYLAAITRDFAGAPITLLDHRIAGTGGQTIIDMRSVHAPMPPSVPDEDTGEKETGK